MRFAYQTIVFGRRFRNRRDFDYAMKVIAGAGFEGVELFQPPSGLGLKDVTSASELMRLLKADYGLELVGLSGGSIEDRIRFLGSEKGPYLYLDGLPPLDKMADWLKAGYRLALHPHAFKPIRSLGDAEVIFRLPDFRDSPNLLFLPDTAHLTIANDDPVRAIRKNAKRLAAVHIKGWDASYGRASHRYSQGFCELFRGEARVLEVLKELGHSRYLEETWVVVELDYSLRSPGDVVRESADALMTRAFMPRREFRIPEEPEKELAEENGQQDELQFRRELEALLDDPGQDYYQKGLRALVSRLKGKPTAALLALSEVNGELTPLCTSGDWAPDELGSIKAPGLGAEMLGMEIPKRACQ